MKKISILLPTRNRFDLFCKSVNSLTDNCESIDNFEILIALDDDDIDTINKINTFIKDKDNMKVFIYERKFYSKLHLYYNSLAEKASGTSLMLWNDDSIITSKNWDFEILQNHDSFCILNPKVENMEHFWKNVGCLFPIIPKKWVDLTKEMAFWPGVDSWLDVLGKRLNIIKPLETVSIYHDRYEITGNNNDTTYYDGLSYKIVNDCPRYPEILENHYQILFNYLNN